MDGLMMAAFAILLGVTGFYWWKEKQTRGQTGLPPVVPALWQPPTAIDQEARKTDFLTTFSMPMRPFDESAEYVIVAQNPWEIRTAQGKQQIEQEALRLHNQAKAAFEQGKMDEARRLATRASANKPVFPANQQLLASIDQAASGSPAPAGANP
jgi:hypothetical protein